MATNVHCREGVMSLEVVINGEHFSLNADERVTMELIARTVAKFYGLAIGDLKRSSQGKRCQPRQVGMYLIREYFGTTRSYRQIADLFGLRDHTAVIHAYKLLPELMQYDTELRQKVNELKQLIGFESGTATGQATR